jgi:hypothetical protein
MMWGHQGLSWQVQARCTKPAADRPHLPNHSSPRQRFTKRTGTPVYMAPEIFERDYYIEADM